MARRATIRAKLVAMCALPLVAVVVLITAAQAILDQRAFEASHAQLEATLRERLRGAAAAQLQLLSEVTKLALVQSDFITLQTIVRNAAEAERMVLGVGVVSRHGQVLAHSDPTLVGGAATGLLRDALAARGVVERYGVEYDAPRSPGPAGRGRTQRAFVLLAPVQGQQLSGAVLLAYSLGPLERELGRATVARRQEFRLSLGIAMGVGLLGLVLGVVIAVLQGVRLSRPIVALSRQVEKMAAGDLGARVELRSTDEIGQLGARFNRMAEELRALMREAIAKATMEKELELAEAGKLAAVGRLAAGVAHEVNNPLTYVRGNLQLLEDELEHDEELLHLTREALDGVDRIAAVIRQLSEFSRSSRVEVPGRVGPAIESAAKIAMVQLRDRARLRVEVDEDLPQVAIDEGKLSQVVLNLLVNAAHAIPVGHLEGNEIRVTARRSGEGVTIMVEDSGSGIPAAVLPHIFESFFTTKEVGQGYGLGLSISRALVTAVAGTISVENRQEGGARFTIVLPLAPDRPAAPEPGQARTVPRWSGERHRLLLVDDDAAVLGSLSRTLAPAFDVTTVDNLGAARRALFSDQTFDVVLCDVMMPEGSGLDLVEAVERERPALLERLVLITGGAPGRELRRSGVPILAKPFGLDDLLRLLEQERPAVGSRGGATAGRQDPEGSANAPEEPPRREVGGGAATTARS